MKTCNTWKDTLTYVNSLGVAHSTMPISWKQLVLMANVKLIEGLAINKYPIAVHYSRKDDSFTVDQLTVKAIHR